MKTMKKGDSVIRVKENDVDNKISNGYSYCPKKEWKDRNGKAAKQEERTTVLKEKAEEIKKEKKVKKEVKEVKEQKKDKKKK